VTVPITDDISGYIRFWRLVVAGCALWGMAVLVLLVLIWRK
jgi:hypothetical protein